MNRIRKNIIKLLPDFVFFYRYLKLRMIMLLITSISVGLMDSLGLAMFIPLLKFVSNPETTAAADSMGNLSDLLTVFERLGFKLDLNFIIVLMLTFFLFKGIATFYDRYMRTVNMQYLIKKIRIRNINALSSYSYESFSSADAGIIQNAMSSEVERVLQAFKDYSNILQSLVLMLTYSVLAFYSSPEFAVLVFVGGLLSNFIFGNLYSKTKILSVEVVTRNNSFQGFLIQIVSFFKYLKATGTINKYQQFLVSKITDIETTNKKMGVLSSIMIGLREPIMIGVVVAVIVVHVNFLNGGLETILISLLLFYRGLTALTQMQNSYNSFLAYTGSLRNLEQFSLELEKNCEANGKLLFKGFKNDILLENVSFVFNNGKKVLNNICLRISKREVVAIVGESGSGKSTLMNILSGLVYPSSGDMFVDGTDFKLLDRGSYQHRIGYITQDAVIFDDTLFNNVTLWDDYNEVNRKRFQNAINRAHLGEFVQSLVSNELTRLGNNGVSLSGGQKQRVSIARELYKDIDFLLMDEATSSLDYETEYEIQKNIEELKGDYTMVTIAHRLSTIRNVEKLIVLSNGSIEYVGNYEGALSESVVFKRMISLQQLN